MCFLWHFIFFEKNQKNMPLKALLTKRVSIFAALNTLFEQQFIVVTIDIEPQKLNNKTCFLHSKTQE